MSASQQLDRMGREPLHYAAAEGDRDRVAQLLAEGADVNAREGGGWTPLAFAAQSGRADVVALLIAAGAEVDSVDSQGRTPLWRAVFNFGQGNAVDVLLSAGANPDLEDPTGSSPRRLAHKVANTNVREHFADPVQFEGDGQ